MFLPSSPLALSRSKLPAVDESVWYPIVPDGVSTNSEPTDEGVNLGLMFTVQVVGELRSICYYRVSDGMASSGTAALWQIDNLTDVLLASVNFSGHSGTGWRTIDLTTPIKVNAAHGYVGHVWFPSDGTHVVEPVTPNYFSEAGHGFYSEPYGFVYAVITDGRIDYRGFKRDNELIKVGLFERPTQSYQAYNHWIDVIVNGHPTPIPPDPPMVLKWPIPAGWPDAATTGPATDTLFSEPEIEQVSTTSNGQIIENRIFYGGIHVWHNDVIIRNCIVRNHYQFGIFIHIGTTGTLVEDCNIDCYGKNNGGSGGLALGGTDIIVRRCNINRAQDGMTIFGKPFPINVTIEDNFIHHLRATSAGGGTPHYDCLQFDGGQSGVVIRHNTLMNENGDTSTIMIDNEGGFVDDFLIEDNVMYGGGLTFYVDENKDYPDQYPITNLRYYRNLWQPGVYGYSLVSSIEYPLFRGNRYMGHGETLDAPPPEGFTVGEDVSEVFFTYSSGIQGTIIGETVDEATGGLTLGIGFQASQDGQIIAVNFSRPSTSTTQMLKVGVWRFTGANKDAGTELLGTETFDYVLKTGLQNFPLTTPIDVEAGDNLVVGVWIPRGPDSKLWYFSKAGHFWPNPVKSQFGRLTSYSNAGTPLNGFTGGNGLYHYGPDIAPPTSTTGFDSNYNVDVVFSAPWPEGIVPLFGTAAYAYGGKWPVVRVGTTLAQMFLGTVTVGS